MNLQTVIISLVTLMLASIGIAVFLSERNRRRIELQHQLARLRQRSGFIKEIALASEGLVDDVNIPVQLLFQASAIAKQIIDLTHGDANAQATLSNNLELISRWESNGLSREAQVIANNNVEIDRYKKQLMEADRILQVSMQLGMLGNEHYQKLHNELAWSTLAIDAKAHLKQGDDAVNKNDLFAAQTHFRHARNNLESSHSKDPRCILMTEEAKAKLDSLNEVELANKK